MTQPQVPRIFSADRRMMRIRRAQAHQRREGAATFIWDEIAEDMIDRLSFVRHQPERSLVIGPSPQPLLVHLGTGSVEQTNKIDIEAPFPSSGHTLIAVLGMLDAVNDLPGALIHMRNALAPDGMAIASFVGGGSLPRLRAALFAAEPDRPAARIHPLVDPRAAPGLLQRAGWKDPVVDSHPLKVRYSSLDRLVQDLRDHGLGSALADVPPPLSRKSLDMARAAFLNHAESDGKVTETIEILTLTGRRSLAGT
ncbi:MAG: methyltransferase [Pseudomonadota bacterium]